MTDRPTIGRIVLYYGMLPGYAHAQDITPMPAIVVEVFSDNAATLHVFRPEATRKERGVTRYMRSVPYSETPKLGHWCWPSKG